MVRLTRHVDEPPVEKHCPCQVSFATWPSPAEHTSPVICQQRHLLFSPARSTYLQSSKPHATCNELPMMATSSPNTHLRALYLKLDGNLSMYILPCVQASRACGSARCTLRLGTSTKGAREWQGNLALEPSCRSHAAAWQRGRLRRCWAFRLPGCRASSCFYIILYCIISFYLALNM